MAKKTDQVRMVPVSYTLPPDMRDQVTREAERQELDSSSSLIRRILRSYFKKKPQIHEQ